MEGLCRFLPNLTPNHAFQKERQVSERAGSALFRKSRPLGSHSSLTSGKRDSNTCGLQFLSPPHRSSKGEHRPLQIGADSWERKVKEASWEDDPKAPRCASGGSYPGCASWTWRARECASSWNSRRRHSAGRSAAGSGGGHTWQAWLRLKVRRTGNPGFSSRRSKVIPTGAARGSRSLGFLSRSPHLKDLSLVNWPKRHVGHLAETGFLKGDSAQSQPPIRSPQTKHVKLQEQKRSFCIRGPRHPQGTRNPAHRFKFDSPGSETTANL